MSTPTLSEGLRQLLATREPAHLGPESRAGVLSESAISHHVGTALALHEYAVAQSELIRAVVLLWHDHLERAHEIAQGIETPSGAFVHAIMHRREPDYWNSKYWWQRTRLHPCFPEIARQTTALLKARNAPELLGQLVVENQWRPQEFVDACERVAGRPAMDPEVSLLREIQRLEHEVLLEYFCRTEPGRLGSA